MSESGKVMRPPLMRKLLTIGEFSLSPTSRRGASYTVTYGGAPTPYTIEKHALWCLFLDGEALPIGRYARLEEALAAAISHMSQADHRRR
jgi:hypothetical protein